MKKILLFLIFPIIAVAQDFKQLKKINDIEVNYKFTKLNSNLKFDKYLLEIVFKNIGPSDLTPRCRLYSRISHRHRSIVALLGVAWSRSSRASRCDIARWILCWW